MKLLLLALVGVCWAGPTSVKEYEILQAGRVPVKYYDIFQDPFSDEMINFINFESGANWTVRKSCKDMVSCFFFTEISPTKGDFSEKNT